MIMGVAACKRIDHYKQQHFNIFEHLEIFLLWLQRPILYVKQFSVQFFY